MTGVNLPMLIKFANLQALDSFDETVRRIAQQGRDAIQVASEVLEKRDGPGGTSASMNELEVTIVNRLGLHARAAAKFVHLAGGVRLARDGDARRHARRRKVDSRSLDAGGLEGDEAPPDDSRATTRPRPGEKLIELVRSSFGEDA